MSAHRSRYSLLTFLVMVTAICVALAPIGSELHRAERRQRAVAELRTRQVSVELSPADPDEQTGLVLGWLTIFLGGEQFPNADTIHFHQPPAERDLALLAEFPELKRLWLTGAEVDDSCLQRLTVLDSIQQLSLDHTRVTDQGLVWLEELPQLSTLTLRHCEITDSGMSTLARLPQLSTLSLRQPTLTDAGVERLRTAKSLVVLALSETVVTPQGVLNIRQAMPDLVVTIQEVFPGRSLDLPSTATMPTIKWLRLDCTCVPDGVLACLNDARLLERLDLEGDQITDEGLASLTSLTQLEALTVTCPRIRGEGLAHLSGLRRLKQLTICSPVDNDSLRHLERIATLEFLHLQSAEISDSGLDHLQNLPALKVLILDATRATAAGVQNLQAALPGCKIRLAGSSHP